MSLSKFIKIYDNKVEPTLIANLIKFSNKSFKDNQFAVASVGAAQNVNKSIRDVKNLPMGEFSPSLTNVHWHNLLTWMVKNTILVYCKEFRSLDMEGSLDHVQVLRYGSSNHYDWHVDDGPGMTRRLSFVMMLNNDYEGGELQFRIDDEIKTIDVKVGRMIVWPSGFMYPHRVTPITKGVKHTVVCWAR